MQNIYLVRVSRALRAATAAPLCCRSQVSEVADILLKIVAPRLLERGAGVLRADVGHEVLLVEGEAVLLAVNHPPLDRHGVIRIVSVFRAVAGALRAVSPAALIWISVDHGVAPLMLSGVVGATSPGATASVAPSPGHHIAAAAVSDARRVVLRSHGAQFTFLVPTGRVDAALAPGLLTGASLLCYSAKAAIYDDGAAVLASHEVAFAPLVSDALSGVVVAELSVCARVAA